MAIHNPGDEERKRNGNVRYFSRLKESVKDGTGQADTHQLAQATYCTNVEHVSSS